MYPLEPHPLYLLVGLSRASGRGGGGLRGLGTGGRRGALRAGTGWDIPGRRRALVDVSIAGGGRVGPVEDMEPVEAERPRT